MVDKLKLGIAVLLVIAGIVAYYYLSEQGQLVRVAAFVGSVIVAIAIAMSSQLGQEALKFIKGADLERRKVVWPTQRETIQATLMVIVMVIVVGIYLAILDKISFWVIYDLLLSPDKS